MTAPAKAVAGSNKRFATRKHNSTTPSAPSTDGKRACHGWMASMPPLAQAATPVSQ